MTMSPVSAAVAGALISGVVMYTVGERSEKVDAFAQQSGEFGDRLPADRAREGEHRVADVSLRDRSVTSPFLL